jgi:hypothetical protein
VVNRLFFQLIVLILVSVLTGVILSKFGINLLLGILAGVVLQYAVYNGFIYVLETYTAIKAKKLENEQLRELAYQGVTVTCPCLQRVKEFVPIRFNTPNYYKCGTCAKTVNVFIDTETALVTEPLPDTDISSIENMIRNTLQNVNADSE